MNLDKEQIKELTDEFISAFGAVDSANNYLKTIRDKAKEAGINSTDLEYAIKRNLKRKSDKADQIESQDDLYNFIWDEDILDEIED